MFSAGLPCLAKEYLCINELVEDGKNGRLFDNSEDLCDQLFDTLKAGLTNNELLTKYRENLKSFAKDTWDDQWKKVLIGQGVI